jgi:hypothetical protein
MKKSAAEILLPRTYKEVWKRGEFYVRAKRVKIIKLDDRQAKMAVSGQKKYNVFLRFSSDGIIKQCNCAYSLDGPSARPACKHMIAAAIYWDESRGILRPSQKDIDSHTLTPAPISRQGIINLFKDPLNADLDKVRIIAEYSSWRPQPHARLPNMPKISQDARRALKGSEAKKALSEMEKWAERSLYDPYFCAGEMSAAFCELLDVIKKRANKTGSKETILIIALCVDWFYRKFNKLIDGIEGVWIFPPVRIGNLAHILIKRYPKDPIWQEFNKIVKIAGETAGKKNLNYRTVAEWRNEKLGMKK